MNTEGFWSLVDKTSDCWLWRGLRSKKGYGTLDFTGRPSTTAHRVSWFLAHGYWPKLPMTIDHLCRNKICVNPSHLEEVTNRENILRGYGPFAVNARKTHCKNGHPLSGHNLMKSSTGHRACRICALSTIARCARESRRKRISAPVSCIACGTLFVRSKIGNKYCTRECRIHTASLARSQHFFPMLTGDRIKS